MIPPGDDEIAEAIKKLPGFTDDARALEEIMRDATAHRRSEYLRHQSRKIGEALFAVFERASPEQQAHALYLAESEGPDAARDFLLWLQRGSDF